MSLQLVLGGSGSGKSTYVYENIIERSMKEEQKRFFILVPDQFTMETQMELVKRHPRGGILNIDVLSFSRLAYRIFEETGAGNQMILDDTGKSLVLRRVAESMKEDVPILGSNLKKIGYIHEVKSAISEFMQYDIDAKKMEHMLEYSKKRGGLYGKLKDLKTLYQGFIDYINERFITTEEIYGLLASELEKSKIIRDSVIVMDGFTGFTPIQNQVIEKLLMLSEEVIMTVTVNQKENHKEDISEQLFSLSKKTISKMEQIAGRANIEIKPRIWMSQEKKRFEKAPNIAHLEENIFRYPYKTKEEETEEIKVFEAKNIEYEVKNTCKQIRELLREGYCYRDIAVIVSDLASYSSQIEESFEEYEIPVFLDQTREITLNPFIEYIRSTIQILVKNYSYETMFHFLRSGMVEYDREMIDELENYCIAGGIKGKKAWSTIFCNLNYKKSNQEDEEEKEKQRIKLEKINNMRNQIVESLSVFKTGKQTVKKQVSQLYEFIVNNECQNRLKTYAEAFAAGNDKSKEKEYTQIYRFVMDLLDQMVSLLGEEVLTWEEFGQILDAGFGEIEVGIIPQNVDIIVVGDMERTRLKQVKALFFLGVNDGKIPRQTSTGGMLSDIDREFLAEGDFELAPTPRQQIFIQKFYLYLNLTKPSHKLFLSYAKQSGDGKVMKPSYFITVIQKLFPKLEIEKVDEFPWDSILTIEEGKAMGVCLLDESKRGVLGEREETIMNALLKVLKEVSNQKPWVERLLDSVFFSYEEKRLSREAAKILYGTALRSSVSRLEKMASCAYAHYLQYGLGLSEREEYSFEAADMGNVFHGVLEEFAGKLANENYTWLDFPMEKGREILKSALETYAIEYENTILFASARNAYLKDKMERILLRTIEILQYQLQKGKFMPQNFEISFSSLQDLDSVSVDLNHQEKLFLQGRIDRIDTYEKDENVYVKILDYKSGGQQFQLASFYQGLQLQLVIYLNAAMELKQKQFPNKNIIPGAFGYYHVTDPLVDGWEGMTEEELQKEIKKQLRMAGYVNSDAEVLKGMDYEQEGKSDVIEIEYKKDGTLGSRSHVMTAEQIEVLQKYAKIKVASLGNEILEGNIAIHPVSNSSKEACTYCNYKEVCGFDTRLVGYTKKECQNMDESQLWQEIRTVVEGKE
ncbi:MAG: helicase-exonuclease AddAB subunit AddB [Lachnospiraceae bacterium]|nr:helicase-exonuclease AddAB subunit AddB [Lachnospiraceae bacterium]